MSRRSTAAVEHDAVEALIGALDGLDGLGVAAGIESTDDNDFIVDVGANASMSR